MKRRFFAALFALWATCMISAQETPTPDEQSPGTPATDDTDQWEPAPWLKNLRRGEIVATGSFPLTLLASRLTYSLVRFSVKSIQAGQIDMNYAPWFLAPPGAPELEFVEKLGILSGAVGLSTLIAIADFRRGRQEIDAGGQ